MSSSSIASCGVIEQLRRDGGSIDRRLIGLRIIRAIYRADGMRGFYRLVNVWILSWAVFITSTEASIEKLTMYQINTKELSTQIRKQSA